MNRGSVPARYASFESPLGEGHAAEVGGKVLRIALGMSRGEFVEVLRRRYGLEVDSTDGGGRLKDLLELLKSYFRGERTTFDVEVEFLEGTDFERRVWKAVTCIPWGGTMSYSEVAEIVSGPGAARAVGRALGKNPVPIVVPCHRVIRADGSIGGFGLGSEAKKLLLELEGLFT